MAPTRDKWVRRFIIPETTLHKKGFTIYKVTSMIFLNSSHEEVSKVSVWKRYNDFKKLHLELNNLHKQLGIKENFPSFLRSKYFGRFEAEVVEERRKYALKFLEFIGRHSYLYSSDIFIKFFETSHIDNYTSDCAHSLSSDTSEDDRVVALNNSVLANNTTVQNAYQVPCLPKTSHNILTNPCSTLSNIICTNKNEFITSQRKTESHSTTNLQNTSIKDDEQSYKTTKEYAQDIIAKDCDAHIESKNHDRNNLTVLNNESEFDGLNNNVSKNISNCNTIHPTSSVILHEGVHSLSTQPDSTQYILIAAGHMSAAFKHESIAEYEEAFIQYKLGISYLINGIQYDADCIRVASIKDKISKYLTRAEKLYNKHLNYISLIKQPVSELKYYKVLKVMKSVMLVMDIRVNCNKIIKTVEKSSIYEDNINNYILHRQIPYMVYLYAYIETETTIFLILQYASYGKLYDFIKLHYKTPDSLHINTISNHLCTNNLVNEELSDENIHESNKIDNIIENDIPEGKDQPYFIDKQDGSCSMEMPTTQLLEKSQKLLQSVNATLRRSNSIASRLNKSKELRYSENMPLLNAKTITQISQESDTTLSNLYHAKSSTLHSINVDDNNIAENLSIKNFVENKDLKNTNSLSVSNSKNLHIMKNGYSSVLNGNCTILNSVKNKSDSFCNNSTLEFTSIQDILTNNMIHVSKNNGISSEVNSLNNDCSINVNSSLAKNLDKDYDVHKMQYPNVCKENNIDEEQEFWQVPEITIRSWAVEILLALEILHQQNVLICDFKPDNILLDDTGHVRLTYIVPQYNIELSKLTFPYSSPELATFSPTTLITSATDIWSFGVILYELLTGITFATKHPGLFHSHSIISIPNKLSENAKSLLYGILKYYPNERLTIDEIKCHPFFAEIDWFNTINPQI